MSEQLESEGRLRVSGTGVAESDADRCVLQVRLRSTAEVTSDAVTRLSELVTAVLAALDDEGVPREAIRTTDVHVGDRRDDPRDPVVERIASYALRIDLEGVERAGAVLSRLVAVAGERLEVQGFEMALSDPDALVGEARRLAVRDARTKAGELADEAGVALGSLLSIEEDSRHERTRPVRATALLVPSGGGPVPPVPIEGGPLAVTSVVTLVFRIS